MMHISSRQIINWVSKNFRSKTSKGGQQLRICNPDGDKRYNLFINTKKEKNRKGEVNYWVHDFRPNHQQYDGSFIGFVMKFRNVSFHKAVQEVTEGNVQYERRVELEESKKDYDFKLPKGSRLLCDVEDNKIKQIAQRYLKNRAISQEVIQKHQLCYTANTIVFPYYEFGTIVYWQERSVYEKRFNFPSESETGLFKTDFLYAFDNVMMGGDEIIIVESAFNCLSLGENVVATCGAMMAQGSKQIKKIEFLNVRNIILAPDNDEAGIKSLIHNYYLLKDHGSRLAYCLPPKEHDWNDYDQENGIGAARKYLENNVYWLSLANISKLISMNRISLPKFC